MLSVGGVDGMYGMYGEPPEDLFFQTAVMVVSAERVTLSPAAYSVPSTFHALNSLPEGAVKVHEGRVY